MIQVNDGYVQQQMRASVGVSSSIGAASFVTLSSSPIVVPDREMWQVTFASGLSTVDDVDVIAAGGVILITSDASQGLGAVSGAMSLPIQIYNDVNGQTQFISVFLAGIVLFSGDSVVLRVTYTNADAINAANVTSLIFRLRFTPMLRVSEQAISLLQGQQADVNLAARLRSRQ